MRKQLPIVFVVVALMSSSVAKLTGQDASAKAILAAAASALGPEVKSVQFVGSGANFSLGQNPRPDAPWPRFNVRSYTATIAYDAPSMRLEIFRTAVVSPPSPPPAEQRQVQLVSGTRAWNMAGENATPALAAVEERLALVWSTPHGFLKAAMANGATAAPEGKKTRISFTAHGKRRMVGLIDERHRVEKVQTWLDNPVLGDMLVETSFSDYRDFGGITFPGRIVQTQGGYPTLELTVSAVQANPAVDIQVPANVQQAIAPAVKADAQKLADGVWYLTGGSHHSVAVEFRDHVVVIEGPQNEERSIAVIDLVKKTIPNKPIKYLVNTHHHFDHSGGIRTYAAEGATILTHRINQPFYEKAFAAPRTLNPDRLAQSKTVARIEAVDAKKVLTDEAMTLELHHLQGNPHHEGFIVAYLPAQKILIQVDAYTPAAPNAPPPATPNPAAVNLDDNIQRLKLDVGSIAALHGRMVTLADLKGAIGRPAAP